MNRIHKKIRFPFVHKLYLCLGILILFGWYKNAFVPFQNHYYDFSHLILVFLYPLSAFLVGALFDYLFKNKMPFNNKLYGLLFSMIIPISTNIFLFLLVLTFLFFLNTLWISRKDLDLHLIAIGKILLVGLLLYFKNYHYTNLLEESHLFVYSYLDGLFGHIEGGLFTSSAFLIILSFVFFTFDYYYKKEIPFYSYGMYLLTLVVFSIYKSDMNFLLTHLFSSDILFLLVFLAPLSSFSPYSRKRTTMYSLLLGLLILPFSLLSNFYEGAYFALIVVNFLLIALNTVQLYRMRHKKLNLDL